MTVVLKNEPLAPKRAARCSCCGKTTWPPFVVWHTGGEHYETCDLFFCLPCCQRIGRGLSADLQRAAALAKARERLWQPHDPACDLLQ
jgi:hypothetical protein